MIKQKRWRVRVLRKIEDWVEVQADDAQQAESIAASGLNVMHVFPGSTLSADKPLASMDPRGVLDDSDDD